MTKLRDLIYGKFLTPIDEFLHDSRAVGIILFACTVISLTLANSAWSDSYISFWHTETHFGELLHLPHSFEHWINDLLMAIFFFLVGMEIKREILSGELSSLKKSILPVAGALGGMIVPALIFIALNSTTPFHHGWGIPMATDIAFSLGIASILGKRVPIALRIFLMALAIIDDLGAILVIALFYGGDVQLTYLIAAAAVCVILWMLNQLRVRFGLFHIILGLMLWYTVYCSGIHATIAGVLFAVFVPTNLLSKFEARLHDPVNFIILPIFALANTAIAIPSDFAGAISTSLSWGIILGLVLGKPIGITLAAWLMVQLKLGAKPEGTSWTHVIGVGLLAGIGFTMSIFIASLAFSDRQFQDISKIAILIASLLAAVAGMIWFALCPVKRKNSI